MVYHPHEKHPPEEAPSAASFAVARELVYGTRKDVVEEANYWADDVDKVARALAAARAEGEAAERQRWAQCMPMSVLEELAAQDEGDPKVAIEGYGTLRFDAGRSAARQEAFTEAAQFLNEQESADWRRMRDELLLRAAEAGSC